MVDVILAATDVASHENPLTPGVKLTIEVQNSGTGTASYPVRVIAVEADAPVYYRIGETVTVRDPSAFMLMEGFETPWITLQGETDSISLITEGHAKVTVSR